MAVRGKNNNMEIIKRITTIDENPRKGLLPVEWVMMIYLLVTTVFLLFHYDALLHPERIINTRIVALASTLVAWGIYRWKPCQLTVLLRIAAQMLLLGIWFPDTYELNRAYLNLDHVFAGWEQALFGCQPSLVFSQMCPWPWFSELVTMGYVSYYPLFVAVSFYYFFCRYEHFERTTFIILASFFLSYVIFIFLPVAGPQFYFKAVGMETIAAGVFPNIGDYFSQLEFDVRDPRFTVVLPGCQDGLFYHILEFTHNAGERPTAAFPSSHVSVAVVSMILAWESRNRWLFYLLLPLAILLFFGTFYLQAHYAIDAIAGVVAGVAFYFLLNYIFKRCCHLCHSVTRR